MTKNKKILFVVVISVIILGVVYASPDLLFNSPAVNSSDISTPSPVPREFVSLADTFSKLQAENKLQMCHYFDDCYLEFFSDPVKEQVALEYKIIDPVHSQSPINIGLLQGRSVDIPGIGTGYLKNKEILSLQDDVWYWELGSCQTNRRVYVDATTGKQAGPIHTYVYCGGSF